MDFFFSHSVLLVSRSGRSEIVFRVLQASVKYYFASYTYYYVDIESEKTNYHGLGWKSRQAPDDDTLVLANLAHS